jgi:amino acid adenylation domain-containing protein
MQNSGTGVSTALQDEDFPWEALNASDAVSDDDPGLAESKGAERIAIIGAACRLPGAADLPSLRALLLNGQEAVHGIAADRSAIAVDGVQRAGLITSPELFDPQFFGVAQREANQMDPQQRLVMELAVEALESAGISRASLAGSRTGVYIGISTFDYSRLQMNRDQPLDLYAGTGNAFSIAANRLSYFLNLAGPSMAVDTACSSSLTATHLAVQALRAGEIDLAIVGGVNLLLAPDLMKIFAGARMLSPEGRCKTFDESADGYVRGEGSGIVILKRSDLAVIDKDRILALIAGTAVNQDGRTNGLTAPSGPAQVAVIRAALADAGLQPQDIDAVELHGTGTPLGDPIEAQALGEVFSATRNAPLAVGSVKTNIGHLEAAAGIAGLLKGIVALRESALPPSLNFRQSNPDIDLIRLKLQVATSTLPFIVSERPVRIGVSSFGFGGTNAHVILEGAPEQKSHSEHLDAGASWLLPLSAASSDALRSLAGRLGQQLAGASPQLTADIVFTASLRRDHMDYRLAVTGRMETLVAALAAAACGEDHPALLQGRRPAAGARKLALYAAGHEVQSEMLRSGIVIDTVLQELDPSRLPEQLNGRWDILHLGEAAAEVQGQLPERLRMLDLAPIADEDIAARIRARLYVSGHALDWTAFQPAGKLAELPVYPWQRRRCWFASDEALQQDSAPVIQATMPGRQSERPRHVYALVGDSVTTLAAQAERVLAQSQGLPPQSLADFCHAANSLLRLSSSPTTVATAITAAEPGELQRGLQRFIEQPAVSPQAGEQGVVFVLTGQGGLTAGAGTQLYRSQPRFRDAIEYCADLLKTSLDLPLAQLLFSAEAGADLLRETRYAQPALVALSWSLAQLWAEWGVKPTALIGHSLGEYTAAALSGMASLDQVLSLVAARGVLMQETSYNARMVAIKAPLDIVSALVASMPELLAVAADNGPESCVLAGAAGAVEQALAALSARGIRWRMLDVAAAFHSPLMEPVLARLTALANQVQWRSNTLPVISNLSGGFFQQAPDGNYWARHARSTVQFRTGVETLLARGHRLFLELGPRASLSAIGQSVSGSVAATWLNSLDGDGNDWHAILDSVAALHGAGIAIDWAGFDRPYRQQPNHPAAAASTATTPTTSQLEPFMHQVTNSTAAPTIQGTNTHAQELRTDLVNQIAKALGESAADLQTDRPFVEMGADSVMLAEAMRGIQAKYGVKISARQLLNELDTIDRLSVYLAQASPISPLSPQPAAIAPAAELLPMAGHAEHVADAHPATEAGGYNILFQQQLALVQQVINSQNAALRSAASVYPVTASVFPAALAASVATSAPHAVASAVKQLPHATIAVASSVPQSAVNPLQTAHYASFSKAYIARTAASKQLADERRLRFADVRASAGFRPSIKELVYPITGTCADGARVWDVDGNEYIDISMDFGVNLFGHGAPFLKAAIHRQTESGLALGTRSTLSGDVAQMLCEMTGMDRVLFCQSGSESVMTAMRLARLLRERSKIAVFRKSYHGHFDGVLGDRASTGEGTEPVAPGILQNFVSDLLLLDYCEESALQAIAANADKLAAVLVEPIQSRMLDAQPREFLQRLRALTAKHGILLIFDEMITGFRSAPGGAQEIFGVEADLVTYGKTIGGGVPMAALAARGNLLDGIDGGIWRFGDDSRPGATTTFFAGTFNNHPLGFALSHAVLTELKQRGPSFQEELSARTEQLTDRLNRRFAAENVPLSMIRFGSVFRFKHAGNLDLLYYHLLHRGLFVWEGRNCFLCDAHGQQEIDAIADGVMDSVAALREGQYLPPKPALPGPAYAKADAHAGTLALSDTQKQIWLASQFDAAGANAYCETVALALDGEINAIALEHALNQLIMRHEALRTTINGEDGTQTVHPVMKALVSYSEDMATDAWMASLSERPFDLSAKGPLRVSLLKVADGPHVEHVLALCAHHILIDGQSLALIIDELGKLLNSPLAEPLPQVQQFRQQLDWLHTANDPLAENFWRERTLDAPPALPLPKIAQYDVAQQKAARWQGKRARLALPADVAAALTTLATRQKTTMFNATLALTLSFLHTLFDRDDLLIGIPSHGRLEGLEHMVGQAAQLMPMRSRLQRGMRFAQLLNSVDLELDAIAAYQTYPLAHVLEPVLSGGDERPGSLTITFNLDRIRHTKFAGLPTRLLDAPVAGVKFDLAINLMQSPDGWLLDLDYQSKNYSHADIERLGRRWIDWAARVAADPALELDRAAPLPAAELQQVLHTFSGAIRDYSIIGSVPAQIALQAASTPEAVAVTADGRHLDYQTLDRAARSIAASLAGLDAGPGKIVAVMLPRSAELVATMLGIFYSGSAYMPIDPDEPGLRREEIFAETMPVALVTTAEIASRLGVSCPLMILETPEALATAWLNTPEERMEPVVVQPDDMAYVIYTSGSTNKPKGVQCTHGGLRNLMAWNCETFPLDGSDALLQKAPYTFDISLWELCWPLVAGARIVVAPPESHRDPEILARLVIAEQVTVAQFVPAMLEAFVAVPLATQCTSLRHLFGGGEALHPTLCDAVHALGLMTELHNLYGPTEATILVTHCRCIPGDAGPIPIGYPIANTTVRIVDSLGRPAAIGIEGDLMIGGVQLTSGYLKRPEQNAKSFVDNQHLAPMRLYRSGDRARWREDGAIEYLGRADNQIKLRGLRIEIGEIEHALRSHPAIQDAVVDLRGKTAVQQRLLAWIVPGASVATSSNGWQSELRSYLATRLPAYMIPAHFVALAALPVSRHGKIDRNALIEPERPVSTSQAVVANSPVEAELLAYLRDALDIHAVSTEDNFFMLGGQSLAASQLITWAQQRWSVRLALKDFFETPTPARLASLIETAILHQDDRPGAAQSATEASAIRPRERRRVRRGQFVIENVNGILE